MKKFITLNQMKKIITLNQLNTVIFMAILGFYCVCSLFCCGVNASAGGDKIVHKIEISEGTVTLILERTLKIDQTEQVSSTDQEEYVELSLVCLKIESDEEQIEEIVIPENVPLPNGHVGKIVTAEADALDGLREKFPSVLSSDSEKCINHLGLKSKFTVLPQGFFKEISANSISIPNSVESILKECFCDAGLKCIEIPGSVHCIEDYCFFGCCSLERLQMPNSIEFIGEACFGECSSLIQVSISCSVERLPEYCFRDCCSLEELVIPNSAEFIGEGCFRGCTSLAQVSISYSVERLPKECFRGCFSLKELEIPNSVTFIGEGCFGGCSSLVQVRIPNSVSFIGERCFGGCRSLRRIKIPDSVKQIGDGCFRYCKGLTQLALPDSVEFIGDECFSSCHALRSIDLPIHLTVCLNRALFFHCVSLEEIRVGGLTNVFKNTNKIGVRCFEGCKFLEKIYFPSNVLIDDFETTFSGCIRLKELGLLDLEERIKEGAIECTAQNIFPIFYTVKFSPLHPPTLGVISTVIIPPSVRKLPDKSFFNCQNISGILFLSDKVESLGDDCFNGCLNLERMNLPEEIRHIGLRCFKNCHILSCTWLKFTSPNDITIGEGAFEGCSCLQSLSLPLDRTIWLPNCFKGTGIM